VEASLRQAGELGLRVMLSEFSLIPGTPDGEACRRVVDMDKPLWHKKTAYTIMGLGRERLRRLKDVARELNSRSAA
jgi:hypothetical protein